MRGRRGVEYRQRLGEIAGLLRMELWSGNEKHSDDKDPEQDRAIWQAIEKLSGVTLPTGVKTDLGGADA